MEPVAGDGRNRAVQPGAVLRPVAPIPGVWQINVRIPGITDVTAPVPIVISVNSIGSILPSSGYLTVIYVK